MIIIEGSFTNVKHNFCVLILIRYLLHRVNLEKQETQGLLGKQEQA